MRKEAQKEVASDGQATRNQMKKRSLQGANEHVEPDSSAAWPGASVSQNFLKGAYNLLRQFHRDALRKRLNRRFL